MAGIFIPVEKHYFQALASTLQFVAQVCDRLWLVPATDRAFAYITYMSPPHVALVCSGPPQKRGHLWLNKVASVLGPLQCQPAANPLGHMTKIRMVFHDMNHMIVIICSAYHISVKIKLFKLQ